MIATLLPTFTWVTCKQQEGKVAWLAVIIIVPCLFRILDWNDNHDIQEIHHERDSSYPNLDQAFLERWLTGIATLHPENDGPITIHFVAAEGGGFRAGYFTACACGTVSPRTS